jgi:hypothetical protein
VWIRCSHYGKFQCDFIARTCALIALVRPILHRLSSFKGTVRNTPKHESRVQSGGSGVSVAKNSNATSVHELSCSNGTVWNAPKHELWVQYGALGCSLWKILTWLHCTNLCINTPVRRVLHSNKTVKNATKHEFRVQGVDRVRSMAEPTWITPAQVCWSFLGRQ